MAKGTSPAEDEDILNTIIQRIDIDELIGHIGENLEPDQVFDEDKLEDWAMENGWTKAAA